MGLSRLARKGLGRHSGAAISPQSMVRWQPEPLQSSEIASGEKFCLKPEVRPVVEGDLSRRMPWPWGRSTLGWFITRRQTENHYHLPLETEYFPRHFFFTRAFKCIVNTNVISEFLQVNWKVRLKMEKRISFIISVLFKTFRIWFFK